MEITFLGTNGWYDTATGNTTCVLVETEKEYIILDAGNGFYKIGRYIKTEKPIYIFLSHFHLDHIIGLHILNKFNFSQGIDVYGPQGLRKYLYTLINKPYSVPIKKLKTKIRLCEINKSRKLPLDMESKELKHSTICYGYRFYLGNRIISYCTDTGLCKNLFLLAQGADLLITECSFEMGQESPEWPHLNPQQAARLAKEAETKRLALLHFDADRYRSFQKRKEAQKIAQKIFKNTVSAIDGLRLRA